MIKFKNGPERDVRVNRVDDKKTIKRYLAETDRNKFKKIYWIKNTRRARPKTRKFLNKHMRKN